jgi:fatty acid desaturase
MRQGMRKRILAYRRRIDAELEAGGGRDWALLRSEHLIQISFFQHERLIHLIVTALFALIEVLAVGFSLLYFSPAVLVFSLIVLILLIPYIRHYFLLENEVQKMYGQYDRIMEKCSEFALRDE